jgi:BirA family biotin operon repressor/biotin-[acetyl-CoA-carboxylase] ligase
MRVAQAPIQWPAEAIWESIAPSLPGFTVEVLPEVDSTNTELMRRAKAGQVEPILLVAEKQTAGRGRLGREWHDLSERMLSPIDWSGLSLAVGVSIAQSLHANIGLKWPNDLWLQDRKVAGILIETCAVGSQRYVVVGVGINITKPAESLTQEAAPLRRSPAWLQELQPQIRAPDALLRIAPALVQTILAFSEQGFAPFQARFNQLDVLRDRNISVDGNSADASATISGLALGVNNKGELVIQAALGKKNINSSEVSIKPL